MVNEDEDERLRVARDPNTSLEILRVLSEDESLFVRHNVAGNPSASPEILEVLSNDDRSLVRGSVAGNPSASIEILEILSRDVSPFVCRLAIDERLRIARDPNTSREILELLSKDEYSWIRSRVSENPNSSREILEVLSKDKVEDVRAGVANNLNTSLEILEVLSKDEDDKVRRRLAINPNTSLQILEILSKDKVEDIRSRVASNPNTSLEILRILSKDKNIDVRLNVAWNSKLSLEILEVLSKNEDDKVRQRTANHSETSLEILEVLSKDKDEDVRAGVAKNPNTGREILEVLSKDKDEDVRAGVAKNPNTSREILEVLSKDKDEDVRLHVAQNPNASIEILEVLSKDERWARESVAQNPNASIEILEVLSKDNDEDVRSLVAQNPNTSLEMLRILSKDKNIEVRLGVAWNSKLSFEILEVLSRDKDKDVRLLVAQNPNTSLEILEALSKDEDDMVRLCVAGNSNTSLEILEVLSKDEYSWIRSRVSENPNTSLEILRILSKDKNIDVRLNVAWNSKLNLEIFEILSQDENEEVKTNILLAAKERINSEAQFLIVKRQLQYFNDAQIYFKEGRDQDGVDILYELAFEGHLDSIEKLSHIFLDQEDYKDVEEFLNYYPDSNNPRILFLRAKLIEKSISYNFDAYLKAAHAGSLNGALAMVEHFAYSDISLAKQWLARAEKIGHPNIEHYYEMLKIKPRKKKFLIYRDGQGICEVVADDTRSETVSTVGLINGIEKITEEGIANFHDMAREGHELISKFDNLREAVAFCLSKEGGFNVVNEYVDKYYSQFSYQLKYVVGDKINIAKDLANYWGGELSDLDDAIEELEKMDCDWGFVFYDPISISSQNDSQSPAEWFPIEDEDDDNDNKGEDDDKGELLKVFAEDNGDNADMESVNEPKWGSFRKFWDQSSIVITPLIAGFTDIEGGHISVSGKWLPTCNECFNFEVCNSCGKSKTNTVSIRSGQGDGAYCVHELFFDGRAAGAFIVFDKDGDYANPIMELIEQAYNDVFDDASAEQTLTENLYPFIYEYLDGIDPEEKLFDIGNIFAEENPVYSSNENASGILIIGEAGEGIDSDRALVTINNIKVGEYKVFIFGHRDKQNNNCLIPRVMLVLDLETAKGIGLKSGFAEKIELLKELELWNSARVFARIGEPLAPAVIAHNAYLSTVRLIGGSENQTIDQDRASDLRLDSLSWNLLLTRHLESEEFKNAVRSDLESFTGQIEDIHHMRGQFNWKLI